jgi:hypothetical protein
MNAVFVMEMVLKLVIVIAKVMLKTVMVNAEVQENSTNVVFVMGQESYNHSVTVMEIP